jgi:hypothetical protein
MRGVADLVWIMSATAAGTAGLIGVGGFWLLRHKLPTPAQGSLIGLTAALSSYVGIGLVAGILMTLQDDPERRTVVNAAIDSLFCGIGSALITGSTVLPALCIAGLVVAKLQRAAFSPNLNNMAP